MKVTLTGLRHADDPKILAIKSLRAAGCFGLAEAKTIVDGLRLGVQKVVEVPNLVDISRDFTFVDHAAAGGARDDVLAFVLDVLALSRPEDARRIMAMPSYRRVSDALKVDPSAPSPPIRNAFEPLVIRVRFKTAGAGLRPAKPYAYLCPSNVEVGDEVVVPVPWGEASATVVGFGRAGYTGSLQTVLEVL